MSEIRRLPKNISDKIAAGEVVERPLSVVKELVENAIDAGSSAISVSITGGGIKQIVVSDNGSGISEEDVELAFEKHATSKIATEHDLQVISTQGFRGEAVSSIAAVSVVDMKTKQKQSELGTQIRISGGRMDGLTPVGLPDGTTVSVSNLFFNVPARLKFLKSESQEAAYVSDLITRYILAFPEISFHYTSQNKTVYHSPGNGDLKSAIYCVYGAAIMDNIVYVCHETNGVKVEGYVSRPGTVMKNRQKGSFFVNRRFVRNTSLHDMVRNAYGPTLVKGEFPFFALNLSLNPGAVDVNVHPNKLQVRFRDAAAVEYVIQEAVSQACTAVRGSVVIDMPAQPQKQRSSVEMQAPAEVFQTALFSGFSGASLKETEHDQAAYAEPYVHEACDHDDTAEEQQTPHTQPEPAMIQSVEPVDVPPSYRLIGSFANTYVLVEQGSDLLIIDQHAAHERLLYDKFVSSQSGASQALLTPYIFTASHSQKLLIDDNIALFQTLGFDIEPFGMLEYKVSAVPMCVAGAGVGELIHDALNEIAQNGGDAVMKRDSIITASCRSAIKAGDKLSQTELLSVADSFLATGVMPTCPHGRPVITVITKKQIEKSFKRVL